jgi:hypothetical protein
MNTTPITPFVSITDGITNNPKVNIDDEQIYHSMKLADTIAFPIALVTQMYQNNHISNRQCVIGWMKSVLVNHSVQERETALRIFDAFVTISFAENSSCLKDTSFLAFSAVASMVISTKLFSSTTHLSPVSFLFFRIRIEILLAYFLS